jgi:transcription initiation factor TFIIB
MDISLIALADKLHSSNAVKAKASCIYRKAHKQGLVRGKPTNVVLAASLYVASRLRGESRTLGHFARATGIPKRNLARCYRSLAMKLDLRLPLQDLVRCVSKLARQVNVSTSTRRAATHIINEAKQKKAKISGRNPMSIAAAALYVACRLEREKITQREIAKAADVTEMTVRNNAASLREQGTLTDRHRRLRDRSTIH